MRENEKNETREYTYRDTETHVNSETPNTNANMEISENTPGQSVKVRGGLSVVIVLLVALFWWGCEGPMGPAGAGVEDLDVVAPTVRLVDPSFGTPLKSTVVESDTLLIRAEADDNNEVAYVEFFFDGTSEMGEDSAIDSTEPYLYTWRFDSSGHTYGIYPLMARAFDFSGNSGDSPVVLITYQQLPDLDTLFDYGSSNTRTVMTLPDFYNDKYWNVRLSTPQTCRLLEIQLEFKQPTSETLTGTSDMLTGGADFQVFAWNSNLSTGFPVNPPLDSTFVPLDSAKWSETINEQWTVVDVSDWNLDVDDKFHVGFSIPNYSNMKSLLRAMPIWLNVNQNLEEPLEHSSIEYAEEDGWGTIQSNWGQRRDFRIRAKVEYPDGSQALLHPDGTATPVQHR